MIQISKTCKLWLSLVFKKSIMENLTNRKQTHSLDKEKNHSEETPQLTKYLGRTNLKNKK
jgi:hypothetical protein